MQKISLKCITVFIMVVMLMLYGVPALAEEWEVIDVEEIDELIIDELIQDYLPEGIALEEATEQQIREAIAGAVRSRPDDAPQIAARAAERVPDHAATVAYSAAWEQPSQASNITIAVQVTVPLQAVAVKAAVDRVVIFRPIEPIEPIESPFSPIEPIESLIDQAETQPPARDDTPASPVD